MCLSFSEEAATRSFCTLLLRFEEGHCLWIQGDPPPKAYPQTFFPLLKTACVNAYAVYIMSALTDKNV